MKLFCWHFTRINLLNLMKQISGSVNQNWIWLLKKKKKKRRLRWANYFVQRCCRGDALFCQEKRSPFDNGNPVKTQTTLHTRQAWSNNYIYEGFIHVIIIIFALTRSCRCIGMFFQAYHTRLEQRLYFIFFSPSGKVPRCCVSLWCHWPPV